MCSTHVADLLNLISREQSQTCTICLEHHLKKQIAVQSPRPGYIDISLTYSTICNVNRLL